MIESIHTDLMLATDMSEYFWPIAGVVAVIAIVASTLNDALKTRQREKTKREVAAYVASGTLDKDTAVAILNSSGTSSDAAAC